MYISRQSTHFIFLPFNCLTATTVSGSPLMIPDAIPFTTLKYLFAQLEPYYVARYSHLPSKFSLS